MDLKHNLETMRGKALIDLVEVIAGEQGWSGDRCADDEISLWLPGAWTMYHGSVNWHRELESLHLVMAFDLKAPPRRRAEILRLLALINEQLWIGHFDLWQQEGAILFRHALLFCGGADTNSDQCERLIQIGFDTCERYYQAFQLVLWAGHDAGRAIEMTLFETAGQA